MIYRIILAIGAMLWLTDCAQLQQPPAGANNMQSPPPGGEPQPGQAPGAAPGAPEPMGAKTVSVSIKVECRDPVDVFYGKEPKYGSGTASHLGGNSLQNHTFQPGDMIWITDSNQNGIGSATISENTHDVTVTCNGISAR